MVTVPVLIGMHITFGLFLKIGLFPYIDALALLVFLPSLFWKQLENLIFRTDAPPLLANVMKLPTKPAFLYAESVVVGLLVSGVLFWNVTTVEEEVSGNALYNTFMTTLRLDQNWGMFSPYPFRDDGWYVIPANDRKGNRFDLLKESTAAKVDWVKPQQASLLFKNYRWRKYFRNIYYVENERHRLYLGKCLCLNWNANRQYEDQLTTFQMYYIREETPSDASQPLIHENLLLWTHRCFDEEKQAPQPVQVDQSELIVRKNGPNEPE